MQGTEAAEGVPDGVVHIPQIVVHVKIVRSGRRQFPEEEIKEGNTGFGFKVVLEINIRRLSVYAEDCHSDKFAIRPEHFLDLFQRQAQRFCDDLQHEEKAAVGITERVQGSSQVSIGKSEEDESGD